MSAIPGTFEEEEASSSNSGKSEVTSVIHHNVRLGMEGRYETWLKEITPIAQRFQGHRGVNVIRPPKGSRAYTIVLHFATLGSLERWLSSETRKQLIDRVEPLLERGDQVEIKTGLEFWFTPPDSEQKRAKPYKQFLLTLSVIFPLTIIVPWVLRPLFHVVPVLGVPGISNLIVAAVIVGLMTYVVMPRYTRLVAAWLYR
jgi:antibiotic biosynthesis monooxygenase (ABM) superfamily enzyme